MSPRIQTALFVLICALTVLVMSVYRQQTDTSATPSMPAHMGSCAEVLEAPTDGNCRAYERSLLGRGYLKTDSNEYYLPERRHVTE